MTLRKRISPLVLMLLAAVVLVLLFADGTDPAEFHRPPLEENPYSPTDFVLEKGYLTCTAGESVLGIDVSEFQLDIDWEQVKAAGVEFVFIRVGWRGTESGLLNADKRAQEYYDGAKAAGLQVGAYFFSQAVSIREAKEEADFALSVIEDWELDLPLVYDWEYVSDSARTANVDRRTLTDCTKAFCRQVEFHGYRPMAYFNTSQALHMLHLEELTEFEFWLAQYQSGLDFAYRVDCWQYTGQGSVPGISVPVDINLWLE
jgi:GH25 family lysozyme M1 (1,4-beta-N-acetylmuramidase)